MTQNTSKKIKKVLLEIPINELINELGFDITNFDLILYEKDFYNKINVLQDSNIFNEILKCAKEFKITKKYLVNLFKEKLMETDIDENERVLLISKVKCINDILYKFEMKIKVYFDNILSFQLQACDCVVESVKNNLLCGEREYMYENKMFKSIVGDIDKQRLEEPENECELDDKEVRNILFVDENKNITYITHRQYIENVKNGRYNSRGRI